MLRDSSVLTESIGGGVKVSGSLKKTKEKPVVKALESSQRSIFFHLHTIFLFTVNDIKTIVVPLTILGVAGALSGSLLTTNAAPNLLDVLARIPQVVFYNWINVLIFDISNQCQPGSVLEDVANKPHRPIPSKRITAAQARRLLTFVIPAVYAATLYLGGSREAVALMVMTWMHNDLGCAEDGSFVMKNLLNALGYMCYGSGAMAIAAGHGQHELNGTTANLWLAIIGAVIFTSVHTQDLPDMDGDAARDRRTVPLVYGHVAARWSIAVPVTAMSLICPAFFGLGPLGYLPPVIGGGLIAFRTLSLRTVAADAVTWKIWCAWLTLIFLLPLFKDHGALTRL
ncbi:MAG: hypothetical protein M1837_000148 [Sclerophora amabilis]|nr:MAG: hypothetical protein M1837_000148 [Sclerophora amabilis]